MAAKAGVKTTKDDRELKASSKPDRCDNSRTHAGRAACRVGSAARGTHWSAGQRELRTRLTFRSTSCSGHWVFA